MTYELGLIRNGEGELLAAFTKTLPYLGRGAMLEMREFIQEVANDNDLRFRSLPANLQVFGTAMNFHPQDEALEESAWDADLADSIKSYLQNELHRGMVTGSIEIHETDEGGNPVYKVSHEIETLSAPEGLRKFMESSIREKGFFTMDPGQYKKIDQGEYLGQGIKKMKVEDLEDDYPFPTGTPCLIRASLRKYPDAGDYNKISLEERLNLDRFVKDYRVRMAAGGQKNAETTAKIISEFYQPDQNNPIVTRKTGLSSHSIYDGSIGFERSAKGRFLLIDHTGIHGWDRVTRDVSFFAVSDKLLLPEKRKPVLNHRTVNIIVGPTLEEVLEVMNGPRTSEKDKERFIRDLYKKDS